jgi:hypothetical protein
MGPTMGTGLLKSHTPFRARNADAWPPDGAKLRGLLEQSLSEESLPDKEQRLIVADLMAEMADRAWKGYRDTITGRFRWTGINWVLGLVGVISSAVGGSVLVSTDLGYPGRWIIGGISILGGLAAGLTALLSPAEEYSKARIKAKLYEDCWREIWQYAITRLRTVQLEEAQSQLTIQRNWLHSIAITTDLTHPVGPGPDASSRQYGIKHAGASSGVAHQDEDFHS